MIEYIDPRKVEVGGPFDGEWVKALGKAVEKYDEAGDSVSCMRVMFEIMEGLIFNESVPVPAKFSGDEENPVVTMTVGQEEARFMLAQPVLNAEYDTYASMKLVKLMFTVLNHDDKYDGIVFGGRENSGFILPTALIASMLALYCKNPKAETAEEEEEDDEDESEIPEGTAYVITAPRPMSAEQFEGAAGAMAQLRDMPSEHVGIEFRNAGDDGLLFIQAYAKEDRMHVELGFDMSEFDWKHPLILANDEMSREEAVEFIRAICVDGVSPDDMEIVETSFHDITRSVFGEEG